VANDEEAQGAPQTQKNKSIFFIRMIWIVNKPGSLIEEYGTRFIKRHAMLSLIFRGFFWIPFKLNCHNYIVIYYQFTLKRSPAGSLPVLHRWEDGDLGLFISHCIQFNFGLNMPNLLFALRRLVESCQSLYRSDISGTRFDPDFKPPELELVSEVAAATMQ
jgi:hypothetical protein